MAMNDLRLSITVAREPVHVVGAGPAGLAAAIALARGGRRVVVDEAAACVGSRFEGDLQGLENWTTRRDALDVMRDWGLEPRFRALPCRAGIAFDAWDRGYEMRSDDPILYLVERGPGEASLDTALLRQARALDVDVRFGSRVRRLLDGATIVATGPKAADALAVGFHFETDMRDGFWLVLDERLAPGGYAYLLVMDGRGTVKSCMFRGFAHDREYAAATVERFRRLAGLRMRNARFHGGVGNIRLPLHAGSTLHPVAGEHAGFQDALAGFGMRYAIESGVLAARCVLGGGSYDAAWRERLAPAVASSIMNRAIYGGLGNAGYRWLLRTQSWWGDSRSFLRWIYASGNARRALSAWAQRRYHSARQDQDCGDTRCTCVWCRCGTDSTSGCRPMRTSGQPFSLAKALSGSAAGT